MRFADDPAGGANFDNILNLVVGVDRLILDTSTDNLYQNADGGGAEERQPIAHLCPGAGRLSAGDFDIV